MGKNKRITWKAVGNLLLGNRTVSLLLLLILFGLVMSLTSKNFFTLDNILAVILNASTEILVAIGMMVLLISGVFDLSVGSVIALSGGIMANLYFYQHWNIWLALLLSLIVCVGIGLLNGFLIAKVYVNPMIVGIAMMSVIRGAATLITGSGIADLPDDFLMIAEMSFLGIRAPIWIMLAFVIIFSVLVSKTKFFRQYYFIGGNEKAALLSGINTARMRMLSFILSSVLAGLSGIVLTARMGAAVSSVGQSVEMRAITGCILGGASLAGGRGGIVGAALGMLFMALMNNAMTIIRVPSSWQSIVTGGILLIVITIDAILTNARR